MQSIQVNGLDIIPRNRRIVTESYSMHVDKLKNLPESNYKWIYDIIDNGAQQSNVVYRTSEYVLIRDQVWNTNDLDININELHMLALISDKRLSSVREIKQNDLDMLVRIKNDSIIKIQEKYNLDQEKMKVYFHYTPSTYQLHIHFVHIEKCDYKTSVEVCINFDDVIKNISIDPEYYHGDMKIVIY